MSKVATVDVSIDCTKRGYLLKLFGHLETADVASMPDFVTLGKIFRVAVVPIAVGVGEESYAGHSIIKN
jgi:hypothetical protein